MDNEEIINNLYEKLKSEDLWFVTEIDYDFGGADLYKLNEYGKLADEREISKVVKEIEDYIGNGAIDITDAIQCWIDNALMNSQISYITNLHNKFEDEELVDGMNIYEVDLNKEHYKKVTKQESKKTETTDKELKKMHDELSEKEKQALRDVGDPNPESTFGIAKRLPEEKWKELNYEGNILNCIEMIHSILTYGYTEDENEVLESRYIQKYIPLLGEEKVKELVKNEIEEYKQATINKDVWTDSEGVSYNSVKFKDESKKVTEAINPKFAEFYDEVKSNKKLADEIDYLFKKVKEDEYKYTFFDKDYIDAEVKKEMNRSIEDKVADILENASLISNLAKPETANKLNALLDESKQVENKKTKFKDKVKAIKKSLKDKDGRLSDETAEEQAKKIAGSIVKKEKEKKQESNIINEDENLDSYMLNELKKLWEKYKEENPNLDLSNEADAYEKWIYEEVSDSDIAKLESRYNNQNKEKIEEADEDVEISEDEEVIEEPNNNEEDNLEEKDITEIKTELMTKRTQDLYKKLTDRGLKTEILVDNGDNEISIIVNKEDGRVIVPVREDEPLTPVTKGSITIDNDNLRLLNQIKDIIEEVE